MTVKHWALLSAGVAGGLALGVSGYASAAGSPSPAPRAHDGQGPGGGHGFGPGFGRGFGPEVHRGGAGGLVTAVSASSLTVHTLRGDTRTIALTSSTTYYEGQVKAARSDVAVGEIVLVRLADPQATSPVASTVTVLPAHLAGFVTKVDGSTMTIVDESGFTRTIRTSAATTYTKDGAGGTHADLTVGALVRAVGSVDPDGTTLDATRVAVGRPIFPKGGPRRDPGAKPGSQDVPQGPPPGEGLDG